MVDALVLGTSAFGVRVRVSSRPNKNNNLFRVVVFIYESEARSSIKEVRFIFNLFFCVKFCTTTKTIDLL